MGKSKLPLLALLAFGGLQGCASRDDVGVRGWALTSSERSVLRFETLDGWHVVVGAAALSSSELRREGAYALAVGDFSYVQLRNVIGIRSDSSLVPANASVDIFIPEQTPNPWWRGSLELYIDAPSAGVLGQYLGYRALDPLPKNQFATLSFPIPNEIRLALASGYSDLRFTIALNAPAGSQAHILDNFRFESDGSVCVPLSDGNVCTSDVCDSETGTTSRLLKKQPFASS